MIKIYLDWNVLSQMKMGEHSELKRLIQGNEKLLIPFSTSHINDISSSFNGTSSHQELINSDLDFISSITNDYCLFNKGKGIVIDFYPPKELFEQNIENKNTFNDISIDGLMKHFGDDELTESLIKPMFDLLKSLPFDSYFKQAFETPENAELMEKIFPGLKENPTMDGLFKSFSKMNYNLNELEDYKDLRQAIQSSTGINRDKIFDTQNPFEFIQKCYDNLGLNLEHFNNESKNSTKWFDEISNTYLKLDLHGYQEDKVNIKKGRKETFKNTIDDAFHAAFASTCNFYVINDKRSYNKTKKVFEKLNINTRVFKPDDFLDFYKKFLAFENFELDISIIGKILNSDSFIESESENGIYRTYYFPYFIFGFFNKIVSFYPTDNPDKNITFLSQDKPTNWFIINKEVEILVGKMIKHFGNDFENEGKLREFEFNNERWNGRKWKFEKLTLRLQAINGHVQLYFDFENE
jgi:hypothetical protein